MYFRHKKKEVESMFPYSEPIETARALFESDDNGIYLIIAIAPFTKNV